MQKVVINLEGSNGFLSKEAATLLAERLRIKRDTIEYVCWHEPYYLRYCPEFIDIVEELGERANGFATYWLVREIPDEYDYEVEHIGKLTERVRLEVREEHLRKLIQLGNEDDIVKYVMRRYL